MSLGSCSRTSLVYLQLHLQITYIALDPGIFVRPHDDSCVTDLKDELKAKIWSQSRCRLISSRSESPWESLEVF